MFNYPVIPDQGPGPLLAFLTELDPDVIAQTAVAFANTDGGTLLIGATQNGASHPVNPAEVEWALREAEGCCTPTLTFGGIETIPSGDNHLVAVRVLRSPQVHAMSDGRVYARAGADNRLLDGREIRQLITAKAGGEFEAEVVPGAKPKDLDANLMAEFMQQQAGDPDDFLGAVTPDSKVTVAGMLLFGKKTQRWLPDSGARLVRYLGKSRSHLILEEPVSGALVPLIEKLWMLIQDQMRSSDDGPEYPAEVVREALINAACHRDYRLRKRSLEVRLFVDRLEIASPGGLPGFLTLDHVSNGRFSRNPRLAWALWKWGYVPHPGMGIQHMIGTMQQERYNPPQFEALPYTVTVRLYNTRQAAPPPTEVDTLDPRQRTAIDYVQQHGSITFHEFCALFPRIRRELLQEDLAQLVEQEHLRKIGSRASVCYILP